MTELNPVLIPNIFVTDFDKLTCCESSLVHRHPFYELVWVANHGAKFFRDFHEYEIPAGAIAFIAPGQIHHWRGKPEGSQLTIVGFTLEQLLHYGKVGQVISELPFDDVTQTPFLTFADEEAQIFAALFATMQDRFAREGSKNEDVLLAYLNLILMELQRLCLPEYTAPPQNTPKHLTQQFRQLVEEHFLQYKQVQDYAQMLGVTLNHLVETVRTINGQTPKQIIQERLVLEAKRLLVHTNDTIAEISNHLAFNTPTYFGAWFKNIEGITPNQFRQQVALP